MGKVLIAAAAVLGVLAIASPASAQTFAPVSSFSELSGRLTIGQGVAVACDVEAGYSVDPMGYANAVYSDISHPTDVRCGTAIREGGPWALSPFAGGGASVLIRFDIITLTGWCRGYVSAPYDSVNGQAIFNGAIVDGAPFDCTINGVLTSSPKLIIVP